MPVYLAGAVMLGVFQTSLNRIDWLSKAAIDGIFGASPAGVVRPALMILGLAVVAFFTRVGSRWFIFNAGRDVEYEVRAVLLHRLHRLGTAFYRTMSAGEIMSRSTGDLQQVRLLFGFGVLNIINVVFAFGSALQVMLTVSGRLTLASFAMLPILMVATRFFSREIMRHFLLALAAAGSIGILLRAALVG